MDETVIRIENISKRFKLSQSKSKKDKQPEDEDVYALKDISFDVKKGETIALIGSNGSGKSTLLNILSGIIRPSSGQVIINGEVASILDLGSNFHPDLSGRENAKMYFSKYRKTDINSFIEDVKEFSGLKQYFDEPLKTYSKGMFLRLAFATVFLQDADIYLLDEVLNVGDEAFRLKISMVYKELVAKNKTILLATHDKQETMAMSSRCVWIEKGLMIRDDKPQNVILEYSKFQRMKFETDLFESGKENTNQILFPKENEDAIKITFNNGEYENEFIQLSEIEIGGKSNPILYREEDINIAFKFLKKAPEYSLSLQIKIRDDFNQPVLFTVSLYNAEQQNFDRSFRDYTGMLEYNCKIPAYFLASGKYYMSFWIGKDSNTDQPLYNERAYHFPNEICFNLRNRIYEFISDPIHFSVHPALSWKVKSLKTEKI